MNFNAFIGSVVIRSFPFFIIAVGVFGRKKNSLHSRQTFYFCLFSIVWVHGWFNRSSSLALLQYNTRNGFPVGHAIPKNSECFFCCFPESVRLILYHSWHVMWTRLRVHMGCLIYITRASLGPLHRFFFAMQFFLDPSFSTIFSFCNWIDTRIFLQFFLHRTRLMER